MATVKLFDVRWVSHTAGPSPVINKFGSNCRTELFFMGCKKAREGNPCKGCFNPALWVDIADARKLDPIDMAKHIEKFAPQKYTTIVGGEPLDQFEGLTLLCEELRKRDFHIIVFTHYTLQEISKLSDITEGWTHNLFVRLLKSIDILVDGEYQQDKRIYDEEMADGFHDAIGSSNQVIWDLRSWRESNFVDIIQGQSASNVLQMAVRERDNALVFVTKTISNTAFSLQ